LISKNINRFVQKMIDFKKQISKNNETSQNTAHTTLKEQTGRHVPTVARS